MSTPPAAASLDVAAAAAAPDAERRKSLTKYVKRMSSVFKKDKSTKTTPQSSRAAASTVAPVHEHPQSPVEVVREEVAASPPAPEPAKAESITQEPPTESAAAPADFTPTSPGLDRNAMQQERARALFAKYGLTLETHEWTAASAPAPLVPRVEKAIRMRVHRSCHRCGTLYGHDKVCLQCEHTRCKKCPRYPKKRTPTDKQKEEPAEQPKRKKPLTLTTRSGNERAYQPATQRIRRTCHKCESLFVPPTATTCEACKHVRCTKCPREPAKRSKWPAGYPGDADAESGDDLDVENQREQLRRIWRKPRRIVRWECEQCHGLFRQGSPLCPQCGHERCDQCTRSPVKKTRQPEVFDPAVVAAVEAKLRALGVDDDPPTSEPEHA